MTEWKIIKCYECSQEFETRWEIYCCHKCELDAQYGASDVEPKTVYIEEYD